MDDEHVEQVKFDAQVLKDDLEKRRRLRHDSGIYEQVPERRPIYRKDVDLLDLVMMVAGVKYNARGDAVVTMVVPYQYTEVAKDLPSMMNRLLHITLQKWSPVDIIRTGTAE